MSVFSECFTELKNSRNLTGAQIGQMCGEDAKEIFCWLNGKRMPKCWDVLEGITDRLQFSEGEKSELRNAYERTLLGEEVYTCHQKIIHILEILHQRRNEYFGSVEKSKAEENEVHLPEFLRLHNKLEILNAIEKAFGHLMVREEKHLYLKLKKFHPEILMFLKMFCARTEDCYMEVVTFLMEGEKASDVHNLEVLEGIAEILVQKNSVDIYSLQERYSENGFEDNWILSDGFAIVFDDKLSGGMIVTDAKWVQFFLESFEEMKKVGSRLGKKECNLSEFDLMYDIQESTGSSLEYMPCLGSCMNRDILERHIYEYIPDREQVIENILRYTDFHEDQNAVWNSCFCEEGLLEFMETGRIENYPYMIYRYPELPTRCELLQNAITLAENGKIFYHLVHKGELPDMKNLYVEQMHGSIDRLVIDLHFEEGVKEQFVIENQKIQNIFQTFFENLEVTGYVYSVSDTVKYMKKVLEIYRQKTPGV